MSWFSKGSIWLLHRWVKGLGVLHPQVFAFEIYHFKQINDTHGHIVGDAVLRQLSLELRRNLRENDLAMG